VVEVTVVEVTVVDLAEVDLAEVDLAVEAVEVVVAAAAAVEVAAAAAVGEGAASSRSVRPAISRAARRVKVTNMMRSAGVPAATSEATRAVRVVVFPVPAPARIRNRGPSKVTASRCSEFSASR